MSSFNGGTARGELFLQEDMSSGLRLLAELPERGYHPFLLHQRLPCKRVAVDLELHVANHQTTNEYI